nr:hypothetical protein CFP56_43228 [Quercus suber]
MPTEFVLSLQPNEGPNFGKIKHISSVTFRTKVPTPLLDNYRLSFKCQCFKDFQVPDQIRYNSFLNQPDHQ